MSVAGRLRAGGGAGRVLSRHRRALHRRRSRCGPARRVGATDLEPARRRIRGHKSRLAGKALDRDHPLPGGSRRDQGRRPHHERRRRAARHRAAGRPVGSRWQGRRRAAAARSAAGRWRFDGSITRGQRRRLDYLGPPLNRPARSVGVLPRLVAASGSSTTSVGAGSADGIVDRVGSAGVEAHCRRRRSGQRQRSSGSSASAGAGARDGMRQRRHVGGERALDRHLGESGSPRFSTSREKAPSIPAESPANPAASRSKPGRARTGIRLPIRGGRGGVGDRSPGARGIGGPALARTRDRRGHAALDDGRSTELTGDRRGRHRLRCGCRRPECRPVGHDVGHVVGGRAPAGLERLWRRWVGHHRPVHDGHADLGARVSSGAAPRVVRRRAGRPPRRSSASADGPTGPGRSPAAPRWEQERRPPTAGAPRGPGRRQQGQLRRPPDVCEWVPRGHPRRRR